MSVTKKQASALGRITKRAPEYLRGVHRAGTDAQIPDCFAVTGVSMCVLLEERPDMDAPSGDGGAACADICGRELRDGDHAVVNSDGLEEKCREAVKTWNAARKNGEKTPPFPYIVISNENHSAPFDARLVLDALAAVGRGGEVYLGRRRNSGARPTLLVAHGNMDLPLALVMPVRLPEKQPQDNLG